MATRFARVSRLSATLKSDGTLEGTLSVRDHTVPWTAERLRERRHE